LQVETFRCLTNPNRKSASGMCAERDMSQISIINIDRFTEVIDASEEQERVDLGTALLYRVRHPDMGNIVLVNTPNDALIGLIQNV